jgi:hypothetical protein
MRKGGRRMPPYPRIPVPPVAIATGTNPPSPMCPSDLTIAGVRRRAGACTTSARPRVGQRDDTGGGGGARRRASTATRADGSEATRLRARWLRRRGHPARVVRAPVAVVHVASLIRWRLRPLRAPWSTMRWLPHAAAGDDRGRADDPRSGRRGGPMTPAAFFLSKPAMPPRESHATTSGLNFSREHPTQPRRRGVRP